MGTKGRGVEVGIGEGVKVGGMGVEVESGEGIGDGITVGGEVIVQAINKMSRRIQTQKRFIEGFFQLKIS